MLFSEPKIPQSDAAAPPDEPRPLVSVLFSEPKIPQSGYNQRIPERPRRFSALQRAENSSILTSYRVDARLSRLQCSSASRKFLNFSENPANFPLDNRRGFSALQRAENSSMLSRAYLKEKMMSFSALQRAENSSIRAIMFHEVTQSLSFSALQRAENSSISLPSYQSCHLPMFQCSSASRKFLNHQTNQTPKTQ